VSSGLRDIGPRVDRPALLIQRVVVVMFTAEMPIIQLSQKRRFGLTEFILTANHGEVGTI